MSLRLHVGCGSVFLSGWCNVDVPATGIHLASARPDLVALYGTTDDRYYGRIGEKTLEDLREPCGARETACDAYGTWDRLPCGLWEADEILARQSFEHLSAGEARAALDECDRVLKPGGTLRVDVPDHEATLEAWRTTQDSFFKRHLLGSRRDQYAYHLQSYTRDTLRATVESHGFYFEAEEPNIHPYPALCLRFRKPRELAPWEYAIDPTTIPDGWRCADIGPASFPWPRADVFVDSDEAVVESVLMGLPNGRSHDAVVGDVSKPGGLPFGDKAIDFAYCSHVLEHIGDPEVAAAELSRVAKRGIIVVPSIAVESLFLFEEADHLWWYVGAEGTRLRAIPVDRGLVGQVNDRGVSGVLCRLFRQGPNRLDADSRAARTWYWRHRKDLDIILPWEGEFHVEHLQWPT